ncbi:hypothetical protein RF55_24907 [Lasius niger]|uniref:Uncharacterized protein n=1 Tax=Lasius niger TaxID=67767 RepID=A0A0J7JUU0_LASNI|nr:hypothetical protein RF55_24907 [Lasius niger]
MTSSNCEHHLTNPTLLNELILKLPMNTRISWSIHSGTIQGHPTIRHFSDWIGALADNIDRIAPSSTAPPQPHSSSDKRAVTKRANVCHASETIEKKLLCSLPK